MKKKEEGELVFLTYILEGGERTLIDIRTELELEDDDEFQIENIQNDLLKAGCLQQKSSDISTGNDEIPCVEITERGKLHMRDLALEKYEEKNKISVVIWAVIMVVAVITFMKLFPRMFHSN